MKGVIVKAIFKVMANGGNSYLGDHFVIKKYEGVDDNAINQQIGHDIKKYGYIKIAPITQEQIDKIVKESK